MQTTNLISTPAITGNIGSCNTLDTKIVSDRLDIWKIEVTTIATNSCTGEVSIYSSWEYTPTALFGGTAAIILAIAITKLIRTILTPL